MNPFDNSNKSVLSTAWESFVNKQETRLTNQVRPFILESWKRSRDFGVNLDWGSRKHDLSEEGTRILLEKNDVLIQVARPYLEKIFKLIKDTGFYIILCNRKGYILDLIYDNETLNRFGKDPGLVLGADRSERAVGTNSIGVTLVHEKPVQIWGEEHYIKTYKEYTCVGATICGPDGKIVGCLSISGPESGIHTHTLAIAVATVDHIERELSKALRKKNANKMSGALATFDDIIGTSDDIKEAKEKARKVAATRSAILLHGESGTGKELFAQAIHSASERRAGPFVAINCGAIPKELVESELFGYVEGAFTGALKRGKTGKLETATGGTLFLDEIESMPLAVQIKLLRALSTHQITKIGSNEDIPIDIRIISATKKNLLAEADSGKFREDLYYRINVITIFLSPLRKRKSDIRLLIDYHIEQLCGQLGLNSTKVNVEECFYREIESNYLRGNVRELINLVESALVLIGQDLTLNKHLLSESGLIKTKGSRKNIKSHYAEAGPKTQEAKQIREALKKTKGDVTKAAEQLGVARSTLYRKIQKLGLGTHS